MMRFPLVAGLLSILVVACGAADDPKHGSPAELAPPSPGNPLMPVGGDTPFTGTPGTGTPGTGTPDGGTPDGGTPGTGTPDGGTPPPPPPPAAACTIDGITWIGSEYRVVARGRVWAMNGDGALLGDPNGADLRSLPGMATGPCAGQAGACQVDTFAWSPERAEYWVAHGTTTWALDGTGALKSVAPHASFPTLLAGPCDGRATGDCKLQAYDWADGGFVIINDGRLWRFDAALNPVGPSTALTSYGGGTMCAALGGNCAIDDFTWRSDIKQFHIIAGGRAWFADASGNLVGNSGAELKTISGFAQGPCR